MGLDKRTVITIAVMALIFLGYPYYMSYMSPPPEEGAIEEVTGPGGADVEVDADEYADTAPKSMIEGLTSNLKDLTGLGGSGVDGPTTSAPPAEAYEIRKGERLVTVDTPLFHATFSSFGGGVKVFELKKHNDTYKDDSRPVNLAFAVRGEYPLETGLKVEGLPEHINFKPSTQVINIVGEETAELVFAWTSPEGVKLEKVYSFDAGRYTINTQLRLKNGSTAAVTGKTTSILTAYYSDKYTRFHSGPVTMAESGTDRIGPDDEPEMGKGKAWWLGLEDKFFLLALIPKSEQLLSWKQGFVTEDKAKTSLDFPVDLGPGQSEVYKYDAFLGPKEYSELKAEGVHLEDAIEFGYFSFMAVPTLAALKFLQHYLVNWGLAIIIFTILIKIAFHPLTKKSLVSMKEMQNLQPQMKALKEKHKDDKTKMNKEIMELYRRHSVNPLGGCVPMVLQIPVFIALYEALAVAIELRHVPFIFWLQDLSSKDPYYVTPLLMGATMFLQQKLTPTSMDPMQSKMMMAMPIVFTFLFLSFPAGLVLYWLTNNCLTVAQHWHIHKKPA